ARQVAAEQAAGSDVSELERQRASSKIKRWTDRETGMRHTLISLDPIRDQTLGTAIRASIRKLRQQPAHAKTGWEQLQVEAGVAACNRSGGGRRVPSLILLMDDTTYRHGSHTNTVCEPSDGTPVPVEVARRLACEAEIVPVILGGQGQALAVGRTQRLATPAQ